MKKKLLLAFILVAMLTCMLAISVSAATTNEFGTLETSNTIDLTGMATDTDLRVVLFDGTEYHTYPAQYIVTNATDITLNFDKINLAFTKEYTKASVIRIEIPRHVKKIVSGWFNYSNNDNLVEVIFPADSTVTQFNWGCFEDSDSLEKVNIPASLVKFDGQNNFAQCDKLTSITFDEGCSITSIPTNFVQSCKSLEEIVFPNSVTSIGGGAFGSCAKLKKVVLSANLQTMGGPMSDCATSGSVWYLSETFYAPSVTSEPPSNMFHWAGNQTNGVSGNSNNPRNITFVYTGTKEQALALQARFKAADAATGENCVGLSRIYNATVCTEAEYEELTGKKVGEIATGYYIVYGYNKCEAFYEGVHTTSAEIKRAFLGQAFASDFKIYTECGRECGKENIIETIGQLIHVKGYATSEIPGKKAMMHSFVVEKTLVSKYQEHFADLKFGILAVGENTSSPFNGSLIDAQGNKAHEKIAMSEYTNRDFDEIEIKIGGIDGYEDSDLYFCGYVIGGESVYYIENETIATTATTITYTQVCAIVAEKENE